MKAQTLVRTVVFGAAAFGITAFNGRIRVVLPAGATPFIANANTVAAIDSIASPARPGSAEPNLTVSADGKVYMSWLEPASPGYALRFAVYDGANWSPPRTIVTRTDFFVNWADFPSMEVLDGSRLAAHWLQRNGNSTYAYGVRIALSNNGGTTWSEPIIPHRDTTQSEHGFVALWNERVPAFEC